MAEKVLVKFAGEGAGTGELSWGQQTVMRGVGDRGETTWLTATDALPDGSTVDDVAELFAFMLGRYQAMRTRLLFGDDGHVQQVVSDSGETWLEIIDVDDDADAEQAGKDREAQYWKSGRDFTVDWPMRMSVIRLRGVPVYRVTAMCHTVADGYGVMAMMADLDARAAGEPPGPVTAMDPLEQALVQASPAGRRRSQSAERHWASMLRAIPARRFPPSADPRTPRYWQAEFRSPAAFLAVQSIAARTQLDTSPVVLAAFAVGLAKVSGINPAVPRVMVSNRFRPRFAETVSPLTQTCLCSVDVAGLTFDQAVSRAWRASLAASKNAYFEPVKIRELVAEISAERGEEIDVSLVFNDRRMSMVSGDELLGTTREVTALPDQDQVRDALERTTLSWEGASDSPLDICHFHVVNSPDSLYLYVAFDTHYVSPPDIEAVFRGMEEIVVAAAFDPQAPTGIEAAAASAGAGGG